jgi:integrase
MSLLKAPRSPFWQYDFERGGRRFRGSTGTGSRREAEAFQRREIAKAERDADVAINVATSLKLDDVAERYWLEVGQHHAGEGAPNTKRQLARLLAFFGPTKLLTEINGDDITRLVAWRRAQKAPNTKKAISPFTINDTTEQLKKLFTRAKVWGVGFPNEPRWRDHWLKVPQERVNELRGDQGERLLAAAGDDYAPVLAFANATGLRQRECMLRWSEIDWDNERIAKKGKGGKDVFTLITSEVRAILEPLRDHHPEFVFTYCVKGERRPITQSGLKTRWRRLRKQAGVVGFRFHDYRHDFATKLLRQEGNLKLVSRALNHSSTKTTEKYAHVVDEDIRAALERRACTRSTDKSPDSRSSPANLLKLHV